MLPYTWIDVPCAQNATSASNLVCFVLRKPISWLLDPWESVYIMPFTPLLILPQDRVDETARRLCNTFGYPSVHPFQIKAGHASLQGRSVLLNIPTGGGKTAAFWYSLFWHWSPGNKQPECQKIVLVVSPLKALMNEQVGSTFLAFLYLLKWA